MIQLLVNDQWIETVLPAGTVLLDLLRGEGLKGVKEGCREGDCGACTVLIGDGLCYATAPSCLTPVGACHGKHIVTIEGLNGDGLSPVQQAIVDEGATQCGFCTPGIVVALTGFLMNSPALSLEDALAAVEGNICRCTGYASIRRASERLIAGIHPSCRSNSNRLETLVKFGLLPDYFLTVEERLTSVNPIERTQGKEEAVLVAGGTDLFVQKADSLRSQSLQFISDNSQLKSLDVENDTLTIGAAVTVEELKKNSIFTATFPEFQNALNLVSSTLIRNRATLAGNIVNASPIGDMSIMLLALNTRLFIENGETSREKDLASFFIEYKKMDLKRGEMITRIRIPLPPDGARFSFEKVSRREHLDIASVNTAMHIAVSDDKIVYARISAGGVAPIPLMLSQSSEWIIGKSLSRETVSELFRLAATEITPIDDVRGTARYKKNLLRRLIVAHFVTLFPEINWEGLES